MAEQSRLELVIEAKNATKRALSGAKRGIKGFAASARQGFARIRKAVFSVRGALTALAGAGAIAALGKKLFDLGADAAETANKFRSVFGAAHEEMDAFLADFRRLAGLTRSEAREAAAEAGGLARAFNFSAEAAADFSEQILRTAGDMASFNNVPTAEAVRAITSALAGERERLKQLNVVLRESDVQQRALARTGKESTDAITEQEKALATLELIQERAAVQMGDLADTQDSAANNARQLAGAFRDAKEAVAEALLPVLVDMFGVVTEREDDLVSLGEKIRNNQRDIQDFARTFLQLFSAMGRHFVGFGQMIGDFALASVSFVKGLTFQAVSAVFDLVNRAIRGINGLIDLANRIKGVNIEATVNELPAEEWASKAAMEHQVFETAVDSMGNTLGDVAHAWARIGDEAERAKQKQQEAAATPGPSAGGGGGGGAGLGPISPQATGAAGMTVGMDTDQVPTVDRAHLSQLERSKSMWQEIGAEIKKATDNQRAMDQVLANVATQTLTGFTQAFQSAAKAAITGSKSMGEAFSTAMLGAIAQVASALAKMYAAKAAAALGEGLMGNPAAFGAAAKFTAAAAAFGALAGVLQGVASGGGGGAAGAARSGAQGTRDTLDRERGKTIINIEGGILDMSDPRQQRALERAFEDVSDRRVIIT